MKYEASQALNDMSQAMTHACYAGLSDIVYEHTPSKFDPSQTPSIIKGKTVLRKRRPTQYDITDIQMFTQMWGSTALGFDGIGGCAITTASVIIITGSFFSKDFSREVAVYFGGRHAYTIKNPSAAFADDVSKRSMADVRDAKKRYETKLTNP